uniref:Kinesin-like protein n=2 Tax=Guillardia theta TaxID=55529 RepID=A0A7S4L123_GUITH|mmetsp:Transcript_34948/g.109250  ORF Transcript_34948/g.109250 Transcript_34948/m.109250 type:complete len:561 (+) Transcript_34948:497-2179(+)
MMEKEAKRLQAQLDSAMSELSVKQEEAKKREERLEAKKREASKLKSLVNRLEKEAKASKSQAVLRQVMGLRPKLMETRKRFLLLRSHVFSTNESVQSMCDAMLVEMRNYCSFILPLPHEQPEKVNAEKLSGTQLVAGLKHMLGKYRGAAELCRKLNVELQNLKGSMRILCRVRPLRQVEQEDGSCVHLRGLGQLSVLDKGGSKEFHFDTTYGPKSTQEELFDDARALLQTVVDGYNVSVFAYGPTGSGKTYSITGGGGKHRGMVYRMLEDLFRTQKERAVLVSLQVKISMFEIYNEKIKDLLSGGVGEQEELRVSTDKHGSVHVEGLKEHAVESLQKGIGLLELGMSVRATGATNLNEHSSRSHLLVRLAVSGQDKRTGERTSGKMYLVDLAGSENVSLSGAEGKALKEAIGINRSLSALHDVMLSLSSKVLQASRFSSPPPVPKTLHLCLLLSLLSTYFPATPTHFCSSSSSSSCLTSPSSLLPRLLLPSHLISSSGSPHPVPQLAAHQSSVRLARRAGQVSHVRDDIASDEGENVDACDAELRDEMQIDCSGAREEEC